ncbi:adenylate/guanylate cyclase domain-containing response regulator [Parapedobacter koreensis]|uniref:Adenylate cyclase, class 3 n=1 Tax=Parapedobacter koreensis TaxID=332977 RepID=A0A1H7IQU0_9SPHI|nr:adenylate/guanylate cyclase domain-containing response regulator [Parapedobacter koreensis]SEK64819.1 Adenylate cyclase, class 3 [Parapedobacter koreensis]
MAKILVVDDEADLEALIRQKFRKKIRENTYSFAFARDGNEALAALKEQDDIDIILTDINMPGMDGLTLLTKLPEANPVIKAVMVSAYGDMDNIRTAMNRGAFDFVFKPVNFDDLGTTIEKTLQHVEQLKTTLRAIKENDILKMYVDENVLNFMTHQEFEKSLMDNETIEGTVVFVDICGFTAITEHVGADSVVKMLNTLFDVIVKEIINHNGHIDKFMGDAVMAVFKGDYHIDRAIDAALAVKDSITRIAAADLSEHGFEPMVSIGVNSGEMISGNIGSASLKRLDYTVIGDTVNVAQRLQSVAKPGQILVAEHIYEQAKQSFGFKALGSMALKNKAQPVAVYEVLE